MDNLGMFKAYDIRTKSESLKPIMEKKLIKAIVKYYKEDLKIKSVVIARDARLRAPFLQELIIEAFLNAGIDVYSNLLQSSTCCFYYTCMKHLDSAGIMVTASHNSSEYIGFKLVAPFCEPIAFDYGINGGIRKIKELYIEDVEEIKTANKGKLYIENLSESYIDYSMQLAGVNEGDLNGIKIYVDFLSGAMGTDFLMAFQKAGAEVVASHIIPDGNFYFGDPNPVIDKSIEEALNNIRKGDFNFGFCFDGDGDRMDLINSQGIQIAPGFNMAIIAPEITKIYEPYFEDFKPKFYIDVKAIPTAIYEIAKNKIDVEIIRNGHSFIKSKLKENFHRQLLASEEESAHYYMNYPIDLDDYTKGFIATENTLFFALLTAKMYSKYPEKYEKAKEYQTKLYRYREWPLHFNDGSYMDKIMNDVKEKMESLGFSILEKMKDGSTLDASLFRYNLPETILCDSDFPEKWCQVAQRISRSEDAMTRWEVVSNDEELCNKMNNEIIKIASEYVDKKIAYF